MDIFVFLVWLICSAHLIFCLEDSYEDKIVFVGGNLEMICDGPNTSGTLARIKWKMVSNFSSKLIFICPSETYGNCLNIDGHILDVQNSYTSSFTIENVSLEDAGEYECDIRASEVKLCIFNMTVKESPVSLTLINGNKGTAINSSFLKVRADLNTTIRCLANTSVYLQWYPNCSDLSYHGCRKSESHNGSRALSFNPRASQNGTILTCRIEKKDEASGNVNTSITLQVEVCVQDLEIVRHDSFESTVSGESALSCQTDTSNFNLTSSLLFFTISYLNGMGNENTSASWENAGELHLTSFKLDSNVNSLSCCVSKTSLCPGVCSEEYFNVLHGSIYLASTDNPDITTVANTNGCQSQGLSTVALILVPWMLVVLLLIIVIGLVIRSTKRARTAEPWSTSRAGSHSHSSKTSSEQGHPPSTSGQAREQVSDVEDQDTCSGYMEMRPIAPVQQYMALLGGGATIEDELGSYVSPGVSPTLTRKQNPTTAEKTFVGDPTYVNTEEILYDNTIMKMDDESFHSE